MAREPGFYVEGNYYPFPDSYTFGDAMLIGKLTGKGLYEFGSALQEGTTDPAVLASYLGVAIWKQNPKWTLDEAAEFVMGLEFGLDVEYREVDDQEPPQNGNVEKPESTESQGSAAE